MTKEDFIKYLSDIPECRRQEAIIAACEEQKITLFSKEELNNETDPLEEEISELRSELYQEEEKNEELAGEIDDLNDKIDELELAIQEMEDERKEVNQ